jgi:pyruvate,water dikinase
VWEQAVARPREVRRGNRRREDFHAWKRLVSPRLITSDGEVLSGTYEGVRVPAGALSGTDVEFL